MVKVLHVIGKMDRAGAETMIMNIYRKIDRTKIQFDFLVFSKEKGDYDDEIQELGGRIFQLSLFSGVNYIKIYEEIRHFFEVHYYKIVHGHIGSLAPIYLKYAQKGGGYGIAHSHSTNSTRFFENLLFKLLSYRTKYIADFFMACSLQAGIDRFGKRIVDSSEFRIINNGIDSKLYEYSLEKHNHLKEKYELENKLVIGNVARFMFQKNHIFLIEVFEEILKKEPNACLVLVGKGKEEQIIRDKVRKLGLESKVIFMGVRTDIPDLMLLFDAFILPSFYEGLGIVGIEAQAAGLPCFFSEGIVREAVVTQNAWRYPLNIGAKKWAELILHRMESFIRHDTRKDIVDAGYDIEYTAKELQKFYLQHGSI